MNRLKQRLLYMLTLLVAALASAASGHAVCDTAQACLQQLREVSADKAGIDAEDGALVERLSSFGDELLPGLVAMLADPNVHAAELASYALQGREQIDVRFLPQIRAGLDRGLVWLAPALCRMPGDEAAREAVTRSLSSHRGEVFGLERCGRRAIAPVVEAARCRVSCADDLHQRLAAALADMGEVRAAALPGLLQIALDPTAKTEVAAGALQMIAALGTVARPRETELLQLRARNPELSAAVEAVLVAIDSPELGAIFHERLTASPDYVTLRDLAKIGPAGARAGPVVVELLASSDDDLRFAAARTLGFIGYAGAVEPLVRLLDDARDVRLSVVAAQALGRLQSQAAIPDLRVAAAKHWYPPVRSAATEAIAQITRGKTQERRLQPADFPREFAGFAYLDKHLAHCGRPLLETKPEPMRQKLRAFNASQRLKQLAYDITPTEFVPVSGPEPDSAARSRQVKLSRDNRVERIPPLRQVPGVALRFDGGWLAGSNRGEWGGELVFIADDGSAQFVLNENVEDIYWLNGQVIALTGLAHMDSNRGTVQLLTRDASGHWSAQAWRVLPGAPAASWLVQTGEVLIQVTGGGTVLLHPDGSFRMAPCAEA